MKQAQMCLWQGPGVQRSKEVEGNGPEIAEAFSRSHLPLMSLAEFYRVQLMTLPVNYRRLHGKKT